MDYQQILELVKEVSKAGLTNFEYTEGNIRIAMSCPQPEGKIVVPASNIALQEAIGVSANSVNGANTAGTEGVAAQSQAAEAVGEKGGNLVKSPLVGTFYTAPSEDAEPFIKVGDTVKKGQTLAIVEAVAILSLEENKGKTAYFGGINKCRFKGKIVPGDKVKLETKIVKRKGPMGVGEATAYVDGKVVVKAELTFMVG